MKRTALLFFALVLSAFAADQASAPPPAAASTPAPATPAPTQDPGLSQLEMTQAGLLQSRAQTLDAQQAAIQNAGALLQRDAADYQNAVKAAHPSLHIHFDSKQGWMNDPAPANSAGAGAPAKPTATPHPAIPPMKSEK